MLALLLTHSATIYPNQWHPYTRELCSNEPLPRPRNRTFTGTPFVMGKLRVTTLRLYPLVGIRDMHHNVRREWLAKSSCHTFVSGKGTLFANFPSWEVTGCFIFRPLVTSLVSGLLVQVKCFIFFPPYKADCNENHLSDLTEGCYLTHWVWVKDFGWCCWWCPIQWASLARFGLRLDILGGWWITKFSCQGDSIESTAPESDNMGIR